MTENKKENKFKRRGLLIAFSAVVVLFIVIAFTCFIITYNFQDTIVEEVNTNMENMAVQGALAIDEQILLGKREASFVAGLLGAINENNSSSLQSIYENYFTNSKYIRLTYFNINGEGISHDGTKQTTNKRDDFFKAINGQTVAYGPFFNENSEYIMAYTAPVMKNENIIGVVSIEVDGLYFVKIIEKINIDKAEVCLMSNSGTIVAVGNKANIQSAIGQENYFDSVNDNRTPSQIISSGKLDFKANGDTFYITLKPVKEMDWSVVIRTKKTDTTAIATSKIHKSVFNDIRLNIILVFVASLIGISAFWAYTAMKYSKKLEDSTKWDPITNIYNRATIENMIEENLTERRKRSGKCALLIMDVDNFKAINDEYGYKHGDYVLYELANRIKAIFRKEDIIGRLGGDEFMVFMPDTQSEEILKNRADSVCEKLRENIKKSKSNEEHAISVSVGIAVCGNDVVQLEELYHQADIALYKAKQSGKKCYHFYNEKEKLFIGDNKKINKI